jgi:SpoVK/Ycf46/Vps4 family AAA+-type ATPase
VAKQDEEGRSMENQESGSTSRTRKTRPFGSNSEFLDQYRSVLAALLLKRREIEKIEEQKEESEDGEESYKKPRPEAKPIRMQDGLEDAGTRYEQARNRLDARAAATLKAGELRLPLKTMSKDLSLSGIEEMVLVSILFYTADREFEKLMDKVTHTSHPSVRTFMNLFGDSPETRQQVRSLFLRNSNLMKNGLLSSMRWERYSEEDFLGHRLEVPLSVSNMIFDQQDGLDTETDCISIQRPRCTLVDLILPEETKTELLDAMRSSLVILHGKAGTGKTSVAHGMASALGSPLMIVRTLEYLRGPCDDRGDIVALLRQARANRAVVVFEDAERLLDDDPDDRMITDFCEEFDAYPGLVILTSRSEPGSTGLMAQQADHIIHLDIPIPEDREALWERFLPQDTVLGPEINLRELSQRYALTGGQIQKTAFRAVKKASSRPEGQRHITLADLIPKNSGRVGQANPDSPTGLITPSATLADVVLPDKLRGNVEEIIKAVSSREKVLETWGFGSYGTGHGIAALFYGESGCGKTLTAEAVAGELGRPLRTIQLSGILNKYVGETEKRIAEVFRAASSANEVLLADEADALFTARVQNSESNSYYINSHINCLLAEMDRFSGIIILSSNRPLTLDNAFERRIGWKLEFPKPNAKLREHLWRMLIPSTAPIAEDVDPSVLAGKFDFTGGLIRQVLLKAAYVAAADNEPISMKHILQAARTDRVRGDGKKKVSSGIGFQASA